LRNDKQKIRVTVKKTIDRLSENSKLERKKRRVGRKNKNEKEHQQRKGKRASTGREQIHSTQN